MFEMSAPGNLSLADRISDSTLSLAISECTWSTTIFVRSSAVRDA